MIHSTKTVNEVLADVKRGLTSKEEAMEFFEQITHLYNKFGECSLTSYSNEESKEDLKNFLNDICDIADDIRDIECRINDFKHYIHKILKGIT